MELAESLARHEIRTIAERYFFGVDTRDAAMVRSCFADSFRFELGLDPVRVLTSADDIDNLIHGGPQPLASNHSLSNMLIELTPDSATSTLHAVAEVSIGGKILVRGLRYTDRWVKQPGAWRIADRRHQPRWQFETTAIAPRVAQTD
ncbi:MAG: nuclear transport factor 2 family protein [Sphingomonadaceae bacterium]|nr:nuclear transport factor 2 family protein [Sphingomonadaceae bacterium]